MIRRIVPCKHCKFCIKHIFPDKTEYSCMNDIFDDVLEYDFCSIAEKRGKQDKMVTVKWKRDGRGELTAEEEDE